jgi:hypothetical protein
VFCPAKPTLAGEMLRSPRAPLKPWRGAGIEPFHAINRSPLDHSPDLEISFSTGTEPWTNVWSFDHQSERAFLLLPIPSMTSGVFRPSLWNPTDQRCAAGRTRWRCQLPVRHNTDEENHRFIRR